MLLMQKITLNTHYLDNCSNPRGLEYSDRGKKKVLLFNASHFAPADTAQAKPLPHSVVPNPGLQDVLPA